MFLHSLHKVWLGDNDGEEVDLYSGLSPTKKLPIIAGVFRKGRSLAFAKIAKSDLDNELERVRKDLRYKHWVCQDYTVFDSPLQQEEAALVRGLLLEGEEDRFALEGITKLIENLEGEDNVRANIGWE